MAAFEASSRLANGPDQPLQKWVPKQSGAPIGAEARWLRRRFPRSLLQTRFASCLSQDNRNHRFKLGHLWKHLVIHFLLQQPFILPADFIAAIDSGLNPLAYLAVQYSLGNGAAESENFRVEMTRPIHLNDAAAWYRLKLTKPDSALL